MEISETFSGKNYGKLAHLRIYDLLPKYVPDKLLVREIASHTIKGELLLIYHRKTKGIGPFFLFT
jgi:hypothetical protein